MKYTVNSGLISPKYQHPSNTGLTWTGRGVKPNWLSDFLAQGYQLDDFLIKDTADNSTVDLFKKLPGRPVTGNAKTSAQRQAAYRARKSMCKNKYDDGIRTISRWVKNDTYFALSRLAKHNGLTESEMLDKLILGAQDEYL